MASHLMSDSALLSQRPTEAERDARLAELHRQMFYDVSMFGVIWSSHYYVAPAPDLRERIERLDPETLATLRAPDPAAEYVHWDDIRFMEPRGGISVEEWWMRMRLARDAMRQPLPLVGLGGEPMSYAEPDQVRLALEAVDRAETERPADALSDEATHSSILAGAKVPEQQTRVMTRRRAPTDEDERMVARAARALHLARDAAAVALTPALILELQQVLAGDGAGEAASGPTIERLQRLCDFANRDDGVHPVVRAVLVHFWLMHDHPFQTANSRTARALFYWAVGRAGLRVFEGLSISRELTLTPSQYCRSFLEADTDGGDVTYFLIDQLSVIERAIARREAERP